MTGVNTYSTTAANNINSNTGIDWDEGMSPAAVNNSARQNMADTRAAFNDLIWFRYGKGDLSYDGVYASATSFIVAGIDVSSVYHAGRRIKAVGVSTGTIYGRISSSSFSTNTTVNVAWDSGTLSNESLAIYLSQVSVTGDPVPPEAIAGYETGSWTPADASGASLSLNTVSAAYTKIGNMVFAYAAFIYPANSNGLTAEISGLPYTCANENYARQGLLSYSSTTNAAFAIPILNTSHFYIYTAGGVNCTNIQLTTATLYVCLIYPVA